MENLDEIVRQRHSVRSYTNKSISDEVISIIKDEILSCNKEGNLNIQLFIEEPNAFNTFLAHYGKFKNVKNYITLIGDKSTDLEIRCGYYGQRLVLKLQELGLNSCFVAMTYGKKKVPCKLEKGQKLVCSIAFGYGETAGVAHKIKTLEDVSLKKDNLPDWYKKGIEFALLAPTAMNQQKFKFNLVDENTVEVKALKGFYSKVDLGIVKYNFELGALKSNFKWK